MGDVNWVDAAQVVSGIAALAAVWLSVVTARSARRVPLTDAYMGAWQSILEVLTTATERREAPPPEAEADRLMRQFRAADHQLSVIEATLQVRVYGRAIRHDLTNLLIDVLYDDPDIREPGRPLTLADMPREEWARCSDEEWVRVVNSVPFAAMLVSQVWSLPDQPDDPDGLMQWYFPTVLQGLDARDSVTAADAPPQQQLAFMLGAYVDAFLLPWIRDASREALMGSLGPRGYRALWRKRRGWRRVPARRVNFGIGLFEPTDRRR
jgi:hypothetical protein